MLQKRKRFCRRRSLKRRAFKRGRGLPYIYRNKVYLGKRPKQQGAGVVSRTLGRILETVRDVTGI